MQSITYLIKWLICLGLIRDKLYVSVDVKMFKYLAYKSGHKMSHHFNYVINVF